MRGWKSGLAAQGSGFPLTSRELVTGTIAGKTSTGVWLPRFSNRDILMLRQVLHPDPKPRGFSACWGKRSMSELGGNEEGVGEEQIPKLF